MRSPDSVPLCGLDEDQALRRILEGTATATGQQFFAALVENLAAALHTHGAWVTEYFPDTRRLRALAFWMGGQWIEDYDIEIAGTPCEQVVEGAKLVHLPDNLLSLYPADRDVLNTGAVSYMGVPLMDTDGRVLGHLAVLDRRPMPAEPRALAIFQIFAARAAAELRRLRMEAEVREREEKLGRLVDSAMDAILELDQRCRLTRLNAAAEKAFGWKPAGVLGQDFGAHLTATSRGKLLRLIDELDGRPTGQRYLWIPGGLEAITADGQTFPAEATLSRFEVHRQVFHTLILRNVHDRLQADQKIETLTRQTELLREELEGLRSAETLIGDSEPMRRVLRDIAEVAETDATVLILGETGTGKEVIARALHTASRRRERPFIKVNCAAIPPTLIESEFFGHEPGSFTGATKKRDGRFTLADRGTMFLDEIGELPLDLQAKLLRVLQEGEFEPVGSSQTKKVDVRVLAATNRDLTAAVRSGTFRQDLYYRLNVFPLELPPLRDRGDDVVRLASTFAARCAERMGRALEPLSATDARRLMAYSWPGNVRELQNVIERAVITSRNGRLNLDRALPESPKAPDAELCPSTQTDTERILTIKDVEELERQSIIRALKAAHWRVAGDTGAAKLLGINPSTLTSRMKALGIKRPS